LHGLFHKRSLWNWSDHSWRSLCSIPIEFWQFHQIEAKLSLDSTVIRSYLYQGAPLLQIFSPLLILLLLKKQSQVANPRRSTFAQATSAKKPDSASLLIKLSCKNDRLIKIGAFTNHHGRLKKCKNNPLTVIHEPAFHL
jgi:hypothetical protein